MFLVVVFLIVGQFLGSNVVAGLVASHLAGGGVCHHQTEQGHEEDQGRSERHRDASRSWWDGNGHMGDGGQAVEVADARHGAGGRGDGWSGDLHRGDRGADWVYR